MEEVRRLRIQERVRGGTRSVAEELAQDKFASALPFVPELRENTIKRYYTYYFATVAAIILFGGLIAPILEVKLGLGGTSYTDFIASLHLPHQLGAVDPIVASFCGGAVGVLSALLIVEINAFTSQRSSRCIYCTGTGYLECATCQGRGCSMCSQTGKVMCTACLCTGKSLATEHDVRADPF